VQRYKTTLVGIAVILLASVIVARLVPVFIPSGNIVACSQVATATTPRCPPDTDRTVLGT